MFRRKKEESTHVRLSYDVIKSGALTYEGVELEGPALGILEALVVMMDPNSRRAISVLRPGEAPPLPEEEPG